MVFGTGQANNGASNAEDENQSRCGEAISQYQQGPL
jgi:hypothetical protein